MSLILEALKKSEAERQRQTGPTLLEVRVVRPQRRYPIWALAVGLLLAINMLLLLVFVFRKPSTPLPDATKSPVATTAAAPTVTATPAPAAAPAAAPAPAPATASPAISGSPPVQPVVPQASDSVDHSPTLDTAASGDNPADEQPAVARTSGSVKIQRDEAGGYSSLPSYTEVNANMPDFRLDLHVYAERARDRYALINMQTVHEGDALSEGARVLAITREGVALDYRGQQFMLHPQ